LGVHEPYDLAGWARWLRGRPQIIAVFGYGGSRGATTLIQSLGVSPPLDGLAVVSAGAGIIGHPYEFVGNQLGVSERTARLASWPFIEPTFAWVRLRQGIDLRKAISGIEAIRSTEVPVPDYPGRRGSEYAIDGRYATAGCKPAQGRTGRDPACRSRVVLQRQARSHRANSGVVRRALCSALNNRHFSMRIAGMPLSFTHRSASPA
jgi:hypothetical protein